MPKKLLATTIILVILLAIAISTIGFDAVDANPFGLAKQINPPPDAKPPIVSIQSPGNNTSYSGKFNISFSVEEPQYFSSTAIANVWYTIDNTTISIPYEHWTLTQGPGVSQYSTSIIAPTLPPGNHSLKIRAQGGSYDFHNFFLIDGYSQVYFNTSDNSITSISPNPSMTTGTGSDYLLNQTNLILIAIAIAIVAVASVSLVYFKRRRIATNEEGE
jgi:hypothetical protein